MTRARVQQSTSPGIDEIYHHTRERWGVEQANRYVTGLLKPLRESARTGWSRARFPPPSACRAISSATRNTLSIGSGLATATSASSPFCTNACTRSNASGRISGGRGNWSSVQTRIHKAMPRPQ